MSSHKVEDGVWKDHLKNKPYHGSENSRVNDTAVNIPDASVDSAQNLLGLLSYHNKYLSPNHLLTSTLDRFESFILGADEKKIEEKLDTRNFCHNLSSAVGLTDRRHAKHFHLHFQ